MSKQHFGKFFLIRLKSNSHLVLEIKNGWDQPEAAVVAGEVEGDAGAKDYQLWFYDIKDSTIRSKFNNFCLGLKGDAIILTPFVPDSASQRWVIDGEVIRTVGQGELVIGLAGMTVTGGPVKASASNDSIQQKWIIDYQPALFFYIKSHDDPRQVLDIQGADPKSGAKVIIYGNKGDMADNQLWYEDRMGIIHSKLNDFVLDASGKDVLMQPYDKANKRQQWTMADDRIQNQLNAKEVLQLRPGSLFCSTSLVPVVIAKDDMSTSYLWSFEFIPDQMKSLSHSGCGKHFTVRSRLSGLVLEVQGHSVEAGSPVAMAYRSDDSSLSLRQHFYADDVTGTIRSVLRNYCINIANDNLLVIDPYDPYKKSQQWKVVGKKIQNRHNLNSVLEVCDDSTSLDARISMSEYSGKDSQHWEISHVPAKCFYIISLLSDKVLDVKGDKASAGSPVIIYDRKSEISVNQLWYEDEHGILRSKLNGYVMDASDDAVKVRPYDPSNRNQQWIIVGDRIQNKYDSKMVIDISGESKRNGASLIQYRFHGAENQRWKFDYIK